MLKQILLRSLAFALVLVVFTVPAFDRATRHLTAQVPGSVLRLNRGFDFPESSWQIAPPVSLRQPWLISPDAAAPLQRRAVPAVDELLPESPGDLTPDVLRGPPSLLA